MDDPRIAPVEDNMLAFWERVAVHPMFRQDADVDVLALHSDIAFPLFNAAVGARFEGDGAARAREVAGRFLEAGLPWSWWLTPSTTSPAIEKTLEDLGLIREPCPGMHRPLDRTAHGDPPTGLEVVRTEELEQFMAVLGGAFDMPGWVTQPMRDVIERCFTDAINVLALLDGRAVACGTAFLTGTTAGLYNIGTLSEARGRGAGYAVTTGLMDLAAEAGADHAILHSSEDGFPLYQRLGFVEVCQVPQYLWLPPA